MTIRIGTWNVEHATPSKNGRRLEALRAFNADIWVLTETSDDLDLGGTYHPVHSAVQSGVRLAERWVTIWSNFSLIELVAVNDASRTVAALYDTPFGPLIVYGTVLPWHSDPGPAGTATNWTEQYRIVPKQAEEWARLRQRYPEAAFCVAGDLNMNLGGPHYYGTELGRQLLHRGFERARLACVTQREQVPTGKLEKPNIDHVCLSASWAQQAHVVEAWVGEVDGVELSDHSGIVVAVERPSSAKCGT